MSEAFTLTRISLNNTTTRDKIIFLLAKNWLLTTKEILEKLKKEHSVEITYQGIHKLLTEMEQEKIAEKHNNQWQLKKDWVVTIKDFFQNTLNNYNGKTNRYDIDSPFLGTKYFEFDNFTNFSVRTAELLESRILANNNDPVLLGVSEYGFWTIKFQFEQLELLYRMIRNCPKSKFITRKETPFGRWILEQYKKVGVICAPIGTDVNIKEDLIIQGDYIMEIQFTDDSKETIEKYWKKWHNINDTLKDFGLKDEPKMKINVKITNSPEMADFLRMEIEKYFKSDSNVS